jgi:WD40 repeat protein
MNRLFAVCLVLLFACLALTVSPAGSVRAEEKAHPDRSGPPLPAGARVRLGTAGLRHTDAATSVAFSPDGKTAASGGADGRVYLWEVATGKEVGRLTVPVVQVHAVLFHGDGKTLFVAGHDGTVRQLDTATGQEQRVFKGHRYAVISLALSPDHKTLLSASHDPALRLWDLATGQELRQFEGHQGPVSAVAFAADGKQCVSAGHDGTLRLWDVATGKEVRRFTRPTPAQPARVESVALAPDGKTLLSGHAHQSAGLWDTGTGKALRSVGKAQTSTRAVAFSPDGRALVTAGADRVIRVWEATSGTELWQLSGHQHSVNSVAFSPDGKTLASAGQDGTVRFWDLATGREMYPRTGHTGAVLGLQFSDDGKVLVSGAQDGTVRLWDTATGKQRELLAEHQPADTAFVASPDGKTVWSVGFNGMLTVWREGAAREIHRLGHSFGGTIPLAFSPDGKNLVIGMGRNLMVFPTATGKKDRDLELPPTVSAWSLVFTPDGRSLAVVSRDGAVCLLDVAAGKVVRSFKGTGAQPGLGGLAVFAPDQRKVASWDSELRLWETTTGAERARFPKPPGAVTALGFSADGRMLALAYQEASAAQATIQVLDSYTGQRLGVLTGHQGPVKALAFTRDGKSLASGSADATVLVWDVESLKSKLPAGNLEAAELAALWRDLGDPDAAKAHRALGALLGAPKQAVAFVQERTQPIKEADHKRIAKLVAELDHDDPAVRRNAGRELEALGKEAEAALQKALEGQPSLEVRRRAQELLDKIKGLAPNSDQLRTLRALEILEQVGSPEARQLLQTFAKGTAEDVLTQEAKAALERLAKRP